METTTEEQIHSLNQQLNFLKEVLEADIIDPREGDEILAEMDSIQKEIKRLRENND